jgi:8-oxo-dGTP pyrophosphatase MutT (NUDIX family)
VTAVDYTDYDTRLAAYALVVEDGRVLLTWYNGAGAGTPCWSLPGGGVEFDETVTEAVVREALEETGHDVVLHDPLTVHSWTGTSKISGRPFKSVRVIYLASVVGGTLGTLEVGGSTDFAAWLELDAVEREQSVADIVVVGIDAWRSRRV